MKLEEKILALRKQKGLTQEQLADMLYVSRQAVSKWETGESLPDIANIVGLSKIFGVSADYLIKDETEDVLLDINSSDEEVVNRETISKRGLEFTVSVPLITTAIFLFLGFGFNWWHPGWMVYLFIPLFTGLFDSSDSFFGKIFSPMVITGIYLILGFLFGWWHPGWVIFLLIPAVTVIRR